LKGASQFELLTVLKLADRFAAPLIAKAAGQQFQLILPSDLKPQTLCDLYSLPDTLQQAPAFRPAMDLAIEALQEIAGDLDLVHRGSFILLPFSAVLALLQHPETRATCEELVVILVAAWFEGRKRGVHRHWLEEGEEEEQEAAEMSHERWLKQAGRWSITWDNESGVVDAGWWANPVRLDQARRLLQCVRMGALTSNGLAYIAAAAE